VRAGSPVGHRHGHRDGDIANRMEVVKQCPSAKRRRLMAQFSIDYINGLNLFDQSSNRRLSGLRGNHDVSNAIGYYTPMVPTTDATSMAGSTTHAESGRALTASTYNYAADKIHYSKDLGGIHMAFLNMWPDSGERAWLGNDLAAVNPRTPVLIFVHDPPAVDSKHFINPNGLHDIIPSTNSRISSWINSPRHQPRRPRARAFATFLKATKRRGLFPRPHQLHAVL